MDWIISIVGGFVGAVIAIAFVMLVEHWRKPQLTMNINLPLDHRYPPGKPAKKVRLLKISIANKKLPRVGRWMMRSAAISCYGFITFYHLDGQDVFGRSMPIKWTRSPAISVTPLGEVKYLDFHSATHIDIHPGEKEEIDIVARYDNDAECYGWCYDNYFSDPPWRNPDWKLNDERYLVKAEVICAGERCVDLFRLINDVPVNAFRLENAQPDDYKEIFQKPK